MKMIRSNILSVLGCMAFVCSSVSVQANPLRQTLRAAKALVVMTVPTAWALYASGYCTGYRKSENKVLEKQAVDCQNTVNFTPKAIAFPPLYFAQVLVAFPTQCYAAGVNQGMLDAQNGGIFTVAHERGKRLFTHVSSRVSKLA